MKKRFPQVVAIITLVLVGISVILTFVGAFMSGSTGNGLMWTGIFGFVAFAIVGWIMIAAYNYIHKNEAEQPGEDAAANAAEPEQPEE